MKSTGITRKLDELGRFTLPIEIRRQFCLATKKDHLEIFIDGNDIILRKVSKQCGKCGRSGEEELIKIADYPECYLCEKCFSKLVKYRGA